VDGGPLYAAEEFYTPGICFDGTTTDVVYLSKWVSGVTEIQEWHTADSGATWSKYRDITTGTTSGLANFRPFSPKGHDGTLACLWCYGRYTDFNDWETAIMGVGGGA
jgi:hypothetical protein